MSNPTPQEIDRIISGYDTAIAAADYADTIVCEMQATSSPPNNYRMVWSNQYSGPFTPDAQVD